MFAGSFHFALLTIPENAYKYSSRWSAGRTPAVPRASAARAGGPACVASAVRARGHEVAGLDLMFSSHTEEDVRAAVRGF